MLLGARLTDPKDANATDVEMFERRIKAGVLFAAPGDGGSDLSGSAAANYSALNRDFSYITAPAPAVLVTGTSLPTSPIAVPIAMPAPITTAWSANAC